MIAFTSDTTLRWSCRSGDYLLWAKFKGIFTSSDDRYTIADIWELRDGDYITITNRQPDLPHWFDLHPLEVSNTLVGWMMKRLDAGYKPQEPVDAPNLWRVFSGDRIVWVGPPRNGIAPTEDGILGLVTFKENALVYGEPMHIHKGIPTFGDLSKEQLTPEANALCKAGWNAIARLGLPRQMNTDSQWRIG